MQVNYNDHQEAKDLKEALEYAIEYAQDKINETARLTRQPNHAVADIWKKRKEAWTTLKEQA